MKRTAAAIAIGTVAAAVLILGWVALAGADRTSPADLVKPPTTFEPVGVEQRPTARILMAGDLMIGRRVGELAARDPEGVFEDVRLVIRQADLALANLESPLTLRPHTSDNIYELEADPALAPIVADGGFDGVTLANNHAGDAGPESIIDTINAVTDAGMLAIGAGTDLAAAQRPHIVDIEGVRVALLAVEVGGHGLAAGAEAGIATWDEATAQSIVRSARADSDVVLASIHGGVNEWEGVDPILEPVARTLAGWGVDVVWGHGPHVPQPIEVDRGRSGRAHLIATSLGNLLFDQQRPPNNRGRIIEVIVDPDGLVAWRVGITRNDDLRVHFEAWIEPEGDAALIEGEWWSLARPFATSDVGAEIPDFAHGDVVDAAVGDVTGSGEAVRLVAYRHPVRDSSVDPRPLATDGAGRSAHVGVFRLDGDPIWMSRRPAHAIGMVAACDGSAAFGYTEMDDPGTIAVGAGIWNGFGFTLGSALPGVGRIGCADVDGDGRTEPVVVRS